MYYVQKEKIACFLYFFLAKIFLKLGIKYIKSSNNEFSETKTSVEKNYFRFFYFIVLKSFEKKI